MALCLATVMLTACGGSDPLTLLLEQAAAKETEARSLAVDSPCTEDNQCSILSFASTTNNCPSSLTAMNYKIYSLASGTAAQAREATDEHNRLASEARALEAKDYRPLLCPLIAYLPPRPTCQANKCVPEAPIPQ